MKLTNINNLMLIKYTCYEDFIFQDNGSKIYSSVTAESRFV